MDPFAFTHTPPLLLGLKRSLLDITGSQLVESQDHWCSFYWSYGV